ncbi:MAG TPA: hypothetical protein VFX59_09055 [Polyangiales bacterium]|nr:hypothetical protein [Polyangiales bacterium]
MEQHTRTFKEDEIIACTGARIAGDGEAEDPHYQVQFDGAWVDVNPDVYERVRQIQDSCA